MSHLYRELTRITLIVALAQLYMGCALFQKPPEPPPATQEQLEALKAKQEEIQRTLVNTLDALNQERVDANRDNKDLRDKLEEAQRSQQVVEQSLPEPSETSGPVVTGAPQKVLLAAIKQFCGKHDGWEYKTWDRGWDNRLQAKECRTELEKALTEAFKESDQADIKWSLKRSARDFCYEHTPARPRGSTAEEGQWSFDDCEQAAQIPLERVFPEPKQQ